MIEVDCDCTLDKMGQHVCGWKGCKEIFGSHQGLTQHITEVHVGSGKRTYECQWEGCSRAKEGRKFNQRQKVLRHIQTHTGDRPFKCQICSKRFSEPNTLQQHMRTHTQERPYRCDFPGCGKSFSVAGSLTIHKRVHSGDKPFECKFPGCGKRFSESSNLTKHSRTHSGERPFKCPECGKAFSRPDQVNRHRRVHERKRMKAAAAVALEGKKVEEGGVSGEYGRDLEEEEEEEEEEEDESG
ncbi:hypothetical protein IE53DRAFT_387843 [Violaceomyces palustris]|uniref:Uncharacterized protein n=1 Tax=Violaceomyces palustris TaxID=1673888 RepID=A0ACD0NVR3_9BASI|nr:hypothetical protein IE53DRAFT_387843 [Violaceomyces palustris]